MSTFPFLAVLLCVMGSLLLLLFMMDRRAKVAAQHQVQAKAAERRQRTTEEEDQRAKDWERAREALRQKLLVEKGTLDSEVHIVRGQHDDAKTKHTLALNQMQKLALQLQSESDRIAQLQLLIANHKTHAHAQSKREAASKQELLDAAQEVAELELVVQALRASKARETVVHSLVPYRGKRGDGRPPIYVECVRDGVLFHPEKKALTGVNFAPTALRVEIERYTGPLVLEKKDKETPAPYVLFLVRPEGIGNYYKATAALSGLHLDFGYELVDADWVLDVDPNAKPSRATQFSWPTETPKSMGIAPPPGVEAPAVTRPGLPMPVLPSPGGPPPSLVALPVVQPKGVGLPLPGGTSSPAFVPASRVPAMAPIASTEGVRSDTPTTSAPPADAPKEPAGGAINAPSPLPSVGLELPRKALPPARTVGERDFVITIDCAVDRVIVTPGGQAFQWPTGIAPSYDQAFADAVAQLIARRQASVRPGEPPYRPVIRFRVASGGLPSYLRAYPALERLGIAMTRENVEE